MKTNYHTHCELCRHAFGKVKDYVKAAVANGYEVIGMSDHGPIENAPFIRMSYEEFLNVYLKEIEEAKIEYKDKIEIFKGLEIEYVVGYDKYYEKLLESLDYLILGCHYYSGKIGYENKSTYKVNNHIALEEYTELIEEALATKYFKILAHPDLFLVAYPEFDSFAENCTRRIIEACIKNDVYMEVNANGMRRGKREFRDHTFDYSYPNKAFWKIVSEYDVKSIIGSDSHQPKEFHDWANEKAEEFALELKLNLITKIK